MGVSDLTWAEVRHNCETRPSVRTTVGVRRLPYPGSGRYVKLVVVTSIQVADDMFVAAAPELSTPVLGDPARWRRWWPDLRLSVVENRGAAGVRWRAEGPLTGTMEVWCEPAMDGFILHYYLHAEPTTALPSDLPERGRALADLNHCRRVAGKVMAFEVKDELEAGRLAGAPARGAAALPAGGGLDG